MLDNEKTLTRFEAIGLGADPGAPGARWLTPHAAVEVLGIGGSAPLLGAELLITGTCTSSLLLRSHANMNNDVGGFTIAHLQWLHTECACRNMST